MKKILHCSDAHLDWRTAGLSRFDDIVAAFEETKRAAIEEKVEVYVFTGDLGDPDSGSIVLRIAEYVVGLGVELANDGIESVWVAGNHDVSEDGHGTTMLSPLSALQQIEGETGVHVFNKPGRFYLPDRTLVIGLPYPSLACPYAPGPVLAGFRTTDARATIVATHLQYPGIVPGEESKEMGRGRDVPFPWEGCDPSWLVLGGHYHERQVWTAPNGVKVNIAGALARLTHGEERHRPSYAIYEV